MNLKPILVPVAKSLIYKTDELHATKHIESETQEGLQCYDITLVDTEAEVKELCEFAWSTNKSGPFDEWFNSNKK